MDRKTIDAYDLYHEVYDAETKDFWEKFPEHIMDGFIDSLPGKSVLNLGSGPGRDSILLRKMGLEVLCIDGSKNMVETTRRLGFKSMLVDMRKLDLPKHSYDGAWAYSSLIHLTLEESNSILRNLQNIVRPGGSLLLGLIEGTGNETLKIAGSPYTRYFEYYDDNKLENLLSGTSFVVIRKDSFQPGHHVYLNYLLKNQ